MCESNAFLLKPEEKCQRLKHMLVPVGSFWAMAAATIYNSDNQYVNVAMIGVSVTSTSTEIVAYAGAAKVATSASLVGIGPYILPVAAVVVVGTIVYCNT
jgi:CBS domain containing-hemolysin-like protein